MVDNRALVVEHFASTLKDRGGGDIVLESIISVGKVEKYSVIS